MTDEDVRNEAEELVHDTFPSMDTAMARRYIEQAERRLRTLLARDRREMADAVMAARDEREITTESGYWLRKRYQRATRQGQGDG